MTSRYLTRPTRTEAQAARDFAEASKIVCLRCGKPMTDSDHWTCRHDEPEFRIMEEVMEGER